MASFIFTLLAIAAALAAGVAGGVGFTAIIVAWLAQFNTFVMILISFLLVFLLRNLLFGIEQMTGEVSLSPGMLLNLPVFFITFGFCLLLNLLSALLPAWLSTRVSIVKAINDK